MRRESYKVNLKGMLADCEANYARLLRLFPDILSSRERWLGLGTGDNKIVLSVQEQTPYTTLVAIKEVGKSGIINPPLVVVRLYHDAKLAEVTACQNVNYVRSKYAYPNRQMVQPDEKHQWNRFLGEWLGHCQAHGYVLEEEDQPLC